MARVSLIDEQQHPELHGLIARIRGASEGTCRGGGQITSSIEAGIRSD